MDDLAAVKLGFLASAEFLVDTEADLRIILLRTVEPVQRRSGVPGLAPLVFVDRVSSIWKGIHCKVDGWKLEIFIKLILVVF